MLSYQLVGDQIADTRIKLVRALEIGEKKRETHDLETLVDGKRVGAVKIAKRLVGEDALRREVWSALANEFIKVPILDPDHRQGARAGAVGHRQLHRSGFQRGCSGWRAGALKGKRELLHIAGMLGRDLHVVPEVRHRIEHDDPAFRHLHQNARLVAWAEHARIEREFRDQLLEPFIGQGDGGTPKYLPVIVPERQRLRIVCGDLAHAWTDGEYALDHLVE